MGEDTSDGRRALAAVLRDVSWTIHRLVPGVAGIEPLPTSEVAVLKQVLQAPGTTVTELARQLGMQQSNTSAAVRSLVDRGLLLRQSSPADGRVTLLVPSEKLLTERDSIETAWSGTIAAAMAHLEPEQVTALEAASDALRALNQALRRPH